MIGVCIAAKNEEASIYPLVSNLKRMGYEIFVIDDGSSDGTHAHAYNAGAIVMWHAKNQGIAKSLMVAWRLALGAGCDPIVQMDAGGSHLDMDIPRLITPNADVVVGSRFLEGGVYIGRPWRKRLSRLATVMCNYAQPRANYTDWTSGFRVFKAEAIRRLLEKPYRARMHGWQIEVLAWAGAMGMTIVERPITYIAGESSFNWKVAWEAFDVWFSIQNHIGPRKLR